MHAFFTVTSEDIQRLTDGQARELVARLCRAELRKHDVSQAACSWGGDQRAKDGGVDVRIDIDPPIGIRGYIRNDRSAFQVKAERFSAGKIPGEMAPKGILRPAIHELSLIRGAYIIVSTRDSLSDSSLKARIKAMADCLSYHGLTGKVVVDFYDSRKIADWVEQYPPIANWIRLIAGRPLIGWRAYSPWAHQETDPNAEYLIDKRVKVFVPDADEGTDVLSAIKRLRTELGKNVSVRIVGLSGVGKTRLVQALFDNRVCPEQPALHADNVIYTDISDNPTPQPNAIIEELVSEGSDCVAIIDNCGPDLHQRLTTLVKRPSSKVRLITIEYDIRDDLPEGTLCYRLEGSSDEVIKELLKRRFEFLSNHDLDKIAQFSDGNARVAYALASTTETTGELARLRDAELFQRLFNQKNADNQELLRCAETASLLYSFDGEDISVDSEMSILATLAEISILSFTRNIAELQRRGLVQTRGKWRAVLPHAISNRLSAQAIEAFPREVLIKALVENAPERVARSFSRRLGYLHESKVAREIVQKWLKPGGRYADLERHDELGRQIFSNIAPVHPEAALEALERAARSSSFLSTDNHGRSQYARVAQALAYDSVLFERAAYVLLAFSMAEDESYNYEPARDMLKALFYCHLSGTEAQSDQRSEVVKALVQSHDQAKQKIGLLLLDAALEASHFTSLNTFEFGARKRGFGWWPRTEHDLRSWYNPFIEHAVAVGAKGGELGQNAKVILGESVRGLWRVGLKSEIAAAGKQLAAGGWPQGWLGVRRILQLDIAEIDEVSLQELRNLEQEIAPRNLKQTIDAKVFARGTFSDDLDDDVGSDPATRYRRSENGAEELGRAAALDGKLLFDLVPSLLRRSVNGKVYSFGVGAGQETRDGFKLAALAREILANAAPNAVSLMFLRGFIRGWHKVRPRDVARFLDNAVDDDVWRSWFPELQVQVALDDVGFARLLKSIELGTTPTWQYKYLASGDATDPLTLNQIATLVERISTLDTGTLVAINLMTMVVFSANDKDAAYRSDLASKCVSFLRDMDWSLIPVDYGVNDVELDRIVEFALANSKSENEIMMILGNLINYEKLRNQSFSHQRGQLLAPFFKHYPSQTLDAIYTPDDDGSYRRASRIASYFDSDRGDTAIGEVSSDALVAWCERSPKDRYAFAARTCLLFEKNPGQDESSDAAEISEAAIRILAGARNKKEIVNIFADRFRPRGWSGSLSHMLRKRLPLFAMLNPTDDLEIWTEIEQAEATFKSLISEEEEREEAEEGEYTRSFE